MPHVIVKLVPGKTELQKAELAEAITKQVTGILGYDDAAVSVGFEEVDPEAWRPEVYLPDIAAKPTAIFKKPSYQM